MASVLLDILTIPPADALTVPFGLLQCHDGNNSSSRCHQTNAHNKTQTYFSFAWSLKCGEFNCCGISGQ